jgi:hypothetical protein
MTAMDFVSRILAGETVPQREIDEFNARMCIEQARMLSENQHDAKGCKIKNCTHGNQQLIDALINHAANKVRA